MRVAQVTTWFYPRIGGVETHVRRVSEGLRRLGCSVDIFTLTKSAGPSVHSFSSFAVPLLPYGLSTFPLPDIFLGILRFDPDVIHCHSYGFPIAWPALLVKRLHGIPFVFTPHSDPYSRVYPFRDLGRAIPVLASDRIIALNKYEANHLIRLGTDASKLRVIPNGFDPVSMAPRPIPEPYIFCLGRVDFRHKGQDLLLDAFPMLDIPHKLVFAGSGVDLGTLRRRVDEVERIVVLGEIDDFQKSGWMSNADLVVMPSRTEAFGEVALEALALGRRVVVTKVGGLQHITAPYATLSDPTPSGLADGITRALAVKPERPPEEFFDQYSWPSIAQNILSVYRELVE